MENEKFWNNCISEPESLRHKVAVFIDNTPLLCKFNNKKYFELEDAIVGFIKDNRHMIFNEVEHECIREDIINRVSNYGENEVDIVFEDLECVTENFLDHISSDNDYNESYRINLDEVIKEAGY